MKKLEIKVNGMVCNGCENRVCNALKTVDGVKSVDASFGKCLVTVEIEDKVTEKTITDKIEDLGFEVVKEK